MEVILDANESKVQENIANWQSATHPLAPLSEDQIDLIYEVRDFVTNLYGKSRENVGENLDYSNKRSTQPVIIYKMQDYIQWLTSIENDMKHDNLKDHEKYHEFVCKYHKNCKNLYSCSNDALKSLNDLKEKYHDVTEKTNYLHNLSEQLMTHQRILKEKKSALNSKLNYFTRFSMCQENVERLNQRINSPECLKILDDIDESISYLNSHLQFKESRVYKMKYESLLNTLLNKVYDFVNNILLETTKQVVDPDFNSHVLPSVANNSDFLSNSAFSLYYGKFQSISNKVKYILGNLEEREDANDQYTTVISDCQKTYLAQRLPIISVAVSKALTELKESHKNDHSILFRSCSLFVMKVCQDETRCYHYFFAKLSTQFSDYLGILCQNLYDTLRPSLISINHIEVLSELCGILKGEMLGERVISNNHLLKYVEVVKQLLQDVEERLVFRANVFFQHDLHGYKPSPGDLAYPDKLVQMENIAREIKEQRPDSRNSAISMDSQEVAQINTAQLTHFRSYTGNSPADLHGMWYPTVKRTLVCLSRLYFCLDRDTFQGLAQEALVICAKTVQTASDTISIKKSPVDGLLFQIKHLLIIREQIAPFQVDFTVKEMALDFSTVQKAAVGLIQHRNHIFTFGSNNALLEFLLEGTPKVKEYLIDSRKEIDKQLKHTCEAFISHVTQLLIGVIISWIEKAEHILKIMHAEGSISQELSVQGQDFGKPDVVAGVVQETQKNIKIKLPEVQRSMQLYLANKETEFILFRPIKNNIISTFMQLDQILNKGGYSTEDQLLIACPSPEQANILVCSMSLTSGSEGHDSIKSAIR
ncbi:hypothetical protein NQ315_004686 [Exocentrus adspersus]|uniref:Conserved oligomeric Golgi complex subunit 3 n=1 Tax=Exocentrus adspersus TaxID=1586481 RepID=A0AAV8VA05_9CUCU|nr:hypothetical protein NQ315_004686 [Exocentrus adspersus]